VTKHKRDTERRIILILKEHEVGTTVAGLTRRQGVSARQVWRRTVKPGGVEVSDANRLRAPGRELNEAFVYPPEFPDEPFFFHGLAAR